MSKKRALDKKNVEDIFALSPLQQGVLYHTLHAPDDHLYVMQLNIKLTGSIQEALIIKAWQWMSEHHPVLRTVYRWKQIAQPVQVILRSQELNFHSMDWSRWGASEQAQRLEAFVQADRCQSFDLELSPFRVTLVKLKDDHYQMVITSHHILLDGWSLSLLLKEFWHAYQAFFRGESCIPQAQGSFKDYIKFLRSQPSKPSEAFWSNYLSGIAENTDLPLAKPASKAQKVNTRSASFKLSGSILQELQRASKQNHVPLSAVYYGIWGLLLQRLTGKNAVFGTTVSGRNVQVPDVQTMLGMLINTIPLKSEPSANATLIQAIRDVRDALVERLAYETTALVDIAASCGLKKSEELFRSIVVLENFPVDHEMYHSDLLRMESIQEFSSNNYDLSLVIMPGAELKLEFKYNALLFDEEAIEQLGTWFERLLLQFIHDAELEISRIELLADGDREKILHTFNDTHTAYPRERTISQLFEEQVAIRGGDIAVSDGEREWTYAELNLRANRIARQLKAQGVGPEQVVGIMAERSLEMAAGILGILKAGGAYLPIDPQYPLERISYMLEDSGSGWLLSASGWPEGLGFAGQRIPLDASLLEQGEGENLPAAHRPEQLAYIIYTSGSTGQPKGVMIEQRSVVRLVKATNYVTFEPEDRLLQTGSLAFDASTFELWGALLNGLQLHLAPQETLLSPGELKRVIRERGITLLWLTSSLFNQLSQADVELFRGVRQLIVGGEALSPAHIEAVRQAHPGLKLVNGYGPTENTTFSTYYVIDKEHRESIPIGQPISNTTVYIVDGYQRLQPIGVPGELCVGGEGLARGYLNREELTKEKFVESPFRPGERMYRTGDLARWTAEGTIEYLGRIDEQVKIRGHRIEPGEIAQAMLAQEEIKEAYVLVHHMQPSLASQGAEGGSAAHAASGEACLCGYYTAASPISAAELTQRLGDMLPSYMVPSFFIQLDELPLNANGKVDRRSLPQPDWARAVTSVYAAPESELETALVELWQEVLGVQRLGIDDDFFERGGHSLKATTLIARIYKQFNLEVPLRELFRHATVRQLAHYMSSSMLPEAAETGYEAISPVEPRAYYPASSVQKRLYAISQLEGAEVSYNIPQVLEITGELDEERFEQALQQLIRRHDSLRTSFELIEGELVQRVQDVDAVCAGLSLKPEAASEEEAAARVQAFIQPFKLSEAPLLRAELLKLEEGRHLLLLDMHHIVSDAVSMNVLLSEWMGLYEGASLPEPAIQYKDYAVWQQEQRQQERHAKQEAYWLQELSGELPVLALATDKPRPPEQRFEGGQVAFEIGAELTRQLRELSARQGTTLYMTLLAAYCVLLHKYTGQEDMIVGTPVAGRTRPELERVIGMFVNTLALRSYPQGAKTFTGFLQEMKQTVLGAQEHQDYPFDELVEKLALHRDRSRNPLFDTMFVLQDGDHPLPAAANWTVREYPCELRSSKFDMTLAARETEGRIQFQWEYGVHLYHGATVERMSRHFIRLLESIAERETAPLTELELLTSKEQEQLLYEFNATEAAYPQEKRIEELFAEQAQVRPEQTAVVAGEQSWTYGELNARANSLARELRERGVGPEQIVGILARPSLEMIAGILGILKAGGAYLPIDPQYPGERIRYMLEDSGARLLLASSAAGEPEGPTSAPLGKPQGQASASTGERPGLASASLGEQLGLSSFTGDILDLEEEGLYQGDGSELALEDMNAGQLAYVIYTSGSTGQPKGVLVEHRSLVNLSVWHQQRFAVRESDRSTKLAGFGFDASVWEIFPYLISGAALHIIDEATRTDIHALNAYYEREGITISFLPTPLCEQFMQLDNRSLRVLLTGGDKLNRFQKQRYLLVNNYGPTENTVVTTSQDVTALSANIAIGRPIANHSVYILGSDNRLLPIGVPGELCISGAGLARGYLNREELTREKFVESPFRPGERMYRTGDLARWTAEGTIEYLGRIDEQVKIRGHRIEPGEIAQVMLAQEEIKEAYVLVHHMQPSPATQGAEDGAAEHAAGGEACLCGYYTAASPISAAELTQRLGAVLPSYMVPSFFIQLEELPLNANGKVDRRSLPQPDWTRAVTSVYAAPESELETALVELWQEVLGVQRLGIDDDFFERGGHSLKATTLIARIYKQFNLEVPLRELFRHATVRQLAHYMSSSMLPEAAETGYEAISPVEPRAYYPASSVQKRLYAISQLEGAEVSYNIPQVLEITGELDKERFEQALYQLIRRHDSLRTSFELIEGELVQRVQDADAVCAELSLKPEAASEEEAAARVQAFIQPFKLSEAPLLRAELLKTGEDRHLLLLDMHHIIADGLSVYMLLEEWMSLYEGASLPEPTIQYKDYAVWQQEQRQQERHAKQEAYWLQELSGELPVLELTTDKARPPVQQFDGKRVMFTIGSSLAQRLRELSTRQGATLYMTLLAVYKIMLHKYTGQEELIVGTSVAGRTRPESERVMGMFVNTLALRSYPQGTKTFTAFLEEIKQTVLGAQEHQDYPFDELVEKLALHGDRSRNPLFDVMFVMQNLGQIKKNYGQLTIVPLEMEYPMAKFDITLTVEETGDNHLLGQLEYRTSLFDPATMERMTGHFLRLLEEVAEQPALRLNSMALLTEEEHHQLVQVFNATSASYEAGQTLHSWFEEQVKNTPGRRAIRFGDQQLTYSELNAKANCLGRILRERGVKPDRRVGILAEPSLELAVAVLAVLKAGGAYVPMDPDHPLERMQYMVADSGMELLLTQQKFNHLADGLIDSVILIDSENQVTAAGGADAAEADLETISRPEHLAYVIYTSGTTGQPKGVLIEHRSIINALQWRNEEYAFTGQDKALQLFSFAFDGFVLSFFTPLLAGVEIVLLDREQSKDARIIAQTIRDCGITTFICIPGLYAAILEGLNDDTQQPPAALPLRIVTLAGDKPTAAMLKESSRLLPQVELVNEYGPTENSVVASCLRRMEQSKQITIGKPIANVRLYVLNGCDQPLPLGVAGELCIGGAGLARGYLNRPELQAEKFTAASFDAGERLYRTGDLARWLPDGNIEYLGRIDHQVKIRGYRIELGEIEARLLELEGVNEAVVTACTDPGGDYSLCAYVTAASELPAVQLRQALAKRLPGYMVPAVIMQLERLPLNASGKVDRRSLPEPDWAQASTSIYAEPESELETALVGLWQEVLGVQRLGIDDDFFERGGHSLKATMLIARIYKQLGREVLLRELFRYPTVRQLAEHLSGTEQVVYKTIEIVEPRVYYPASSVQKRLYAISQLEGAEVSYNIPQVLEITGELDEERFEQALHQLIRRHDSLRTSFELIEGELVQRVQDVDAVCAGLSLKPEAASEEEAAARVQAFIQPFKLSEAPLLRAELLKLEEDRHLLLLDMHHIVSDAVSMNVLLSEWMSLYEGASLPEPTVQYKDYAVWQREQRQQERHAKQEAYWLQELSGELPVLALATDKPRPPEQRFEGGQVAFEIGAELTRQLRELSARQGTTLYMTLLAAYCVLLHKYTGQEDMIVGTPVAGRTRPELERVIGMFVNTLALRSYPQGAKTFTGFLQEMKQTVLGAQEHQDYPFDELVEKLALHRDRSRNPLFDTMFVLQDGDHPLPAAANWAIREYPWELRSSKFDMTLTASEIEGRLQFQWEYGVHLYHGATVERMSRHFVRLLESIAGRETAPLAELELLTSKEQEQLLYEFNATEAAYPQEKRIEELFAEQAQLRPEQTAVVAGEQSWTYGELNARANSLARELKAQGVGPEQIVGILARPSLEMIAGILGILKAGGAYLPIDPQYPGERIRYMLEDSGARLLLASSAAGEPEGATSAPLGKPQGPASASTGERSGLVSASLGEQLGLSSFTGDILDLEEEGLYQGDGSELALEDMNAGQLAYVIYTSGSTGQPKGVLVEHRSLVNLSVWHQQRFAVRESDRSTKLAGFGFDASVWEIFPYLISGAALHMIDEATRTDIHALNAYYEREGITISFLPTPLCEQFMQLDNRSLRVLLTGGDKLNRFQKQRYLLVNNYGPTENTVVTTSQDVTALSANIAIGRPIANHSVYILGSDNRLLPIGVPGELCISGAGLARGYLNREELTKEKFVANPFRPGERMYRTGDLARWTPEGTVEYLGRIDEQVKIRGHRIELGEITHQLLQLDQVRDAAVLTRQDPAGESILCAYLLTGGEADISQWRRQLAQKLPGYMIPHHFIRLEQFPLTPNGKIDYKALPEPELHPADMEGKPPGNEMEALLVQVWKEVLGLAAVGVDDNFFERGGDSIKAVQIAARLHQQRLKLEVKHLFQYPTIEELSGYVKPLTAAASQEAVEGDVRFTPIQAWFMGQGFAEKQHWNQAFMLYREAGFEVKLVEASFRAILTHHDALRMVYLEEAGGIRQYNRGPDAEAVELTVQEWTGEAGAGLAAEVNRLQQELKLQTGPLVQLGLFHLPEGDHLLIVAHHLVMDGISWRILLEDFETGYRQASEGSDIRLPEKSHSFQAWAEELERYANSKALLREKAYWSRTALETVPVLPQDGQAAVRRWGNAETVSAELDEQQTKQLLQEVHTAFKTEMNDVLLAALSLAIGEWSGHGRVPVQLEGHGREEILEGINISRTIGWFTTVYPVVLEVEQQQGLSYHLKQTKETLRRVPSKGIGYGVLKYMTSAEHKEDLQFGAEPAISFNYLGQFDSSGSDRNDALFELSPLPTGQPISPSAPRSQALDVTGAVTGGRLRIHLTYDREEYERQTMEQLAARYKETLLELIAHCLSRESTDVTPSDLGYNQLSLEQLDKVNSLLKLKIKV
ncbi:non-ribosomal peptide synthetase [Paenibacillus ihumii]|uniref:non-ribosomal peptide synthetase n=1 Tax=Paenibacillus ihumii TaxID=687436 RepID=UPI0006D814A3|nr:non-ribosomal peptide synthetase [Paenibacillus ihumii]